MNLPTGLFSHQNLFQMWSTTSKSKGNLPCRQSAEINLSNPVQVSNLTRLSTQFTVLIVLISQSFPLLSLGLWLISSCFPFSFTQHPLYSFRVTWLCFTNSPVQQILTAYLSGPWIYASLWASDSRTWLWQKGRIWMFTEQEEKNEKKTLSFFGMLPDKTAEIQEALWWRERETVSTAGRRQRPSDKGWVFLWQAHPFPKCSPESCWQSFGKAPSSRWLISSACFIFNSLQRPRGGVGMHCL